jgi:hypothetical protein
MLGHFCEGPTTRRCNQKYYVFTNCQLRVSRGFCSYFSLVNMFSWSALRYFTHILSKITHLGCLPRPKYVGRPSNSSYITHSTFHLFTPPSTNWAQHCLTYMIKWVPALPGNVARGRSLTRCGNTFQQHPASLLAQITSPSTNRAQRLIDFGDRMGTSMSSVARACSLR